MEYSVCYERGTKKKSESPTGIEPMTCALHTSRISNVESAQYDDKEREIVNFMLGEEIRKMEYSVYH